MAPPTFRVGLSTLTTLIEIVLDHPSQTRSESCLLGYSRSCSLDNIRVTKHTRNKGGVVLLMGSEVSVWWSGGVVVCWCVERCALCSNVHILVDTEQSGTMIQKAQIKIVPIRTQSGV